MKLTMPEPELPPTHNLEDWFIAKFENLDEEVTVRAEELEVIKELGQGAYGAVQLMRHPPTNALMAVKRVHSLPNDESHKRMVIELHTCMRTENCPQLVKAYGAMFRDNDVWICMEVMDVSLFKFYKMVYGRNSRLPEMFCAKVALAVIEGLNFMKTELKLIHRDVKPSNILLGKKGDIKLCDFGISGHLTNSVAKTVTAGCQPYMAPERVDGEHKACYDARADVWSLGITMIEIAIGKYPLEKWKTPFDQLKQVVYEASPRLPSNIGYSEIFQDFIDQCLVKDFNYRPKYPDLLLHNFISTARQDSHFDLAAYITDVLESK